jgi:transposase
MRCFVDPPDIYLYKDAIDFRKSINGLVMIVEQGLERSAFDPALYIFCNRTRDKLKILYWDNTGFARDCHGWQEVEQRRSSCRV